MSSNYRQLIKEHQQDMPVDLISLARSMGVRVFKARGWAAEVPGAIRREHDGYRIYVNADHSETRQRFTIAHELAHLILHKPLIGDGITEDAMYRSGFSNAVETEANALAADILMPPNVVHELALNPAHTSASLAAFFNVSQAAMDIRLGVPSS